MHPLLERLRAALTALTGWLKNLFRPEWRPVMIPLAVVLAAVLLVLVLSLFTAPDRANGLLTPAAFTPRPSAQASQTPAESGTDAPYPRPENGTPSGEGETSEVSASPDEFNPATPSLRGTRTLTPTATWFIINYPTRTLAPSRTRSPTPTRTVTRTPTLTTTLATATLTLTVTQTPTASPTATQTRTPTPTPTLQRLAFSGDASVNTQGTPAPDGFMDIASMDIAGGQLRLIYAGSALTGNLTGWDLSPDGSWMVIEAGNSSPRQLFLLRMDGQQLVSLAGQPAAENSQAVWSPDGQWIVFRSASGGQGDLFAIRPNGSDLRQLTNGPEDESLPDFSPSGQILVYAADGDLWTLPASGLYLPTLTATPPGATPDGATPTALPTPEKLVYSNPDPETSPRWSPDGASIIFARMVSGNWELYRATLWLAEPLSAANSSADEEMPAWSPDSRWIFFISNRDGNREIYRIQLNGSGLLRLTNTPGDERWPLAIP